jgi:hypothetical protein
MLRRWIVALSLAAAPTAFTGCTARTTVSAVPDNSLSDANVEAGPASCASVAQACAPNAGVSTSVAAVTSDAGLGSCPGIDQACARDGGALYHCVLDWASAQRPSTWCTKPNEFVSIYPDCDGYDIVEDESDLVRPRDGLLL